MATNRTHFNNLINAPTRIPARTHAPFLTLDILIVCTNKELSVWNSTAVHLSKVNKPYKTTKNISKVKNLKKWSNHLHEHSTGV